MPRVELWLWWITDERTGRRRKTSYRMTAEDALARHPRAERVDGSLEVREVPEGGMRTGDWLNREE